MQRVMSILVTILLLPGLAAAQQAKWFDLMMDFSGGIAPEKSPTNMQPNEMIKGHNFILRGTQLELRRGYSVWAPRFGAPNPDSMDYGVRGLYEFHDAIAGSTQVIAVVHDEIWYRSEDDTDMRPLAVTSGTVSVTAESTTVTGTGTNWLMEVFPDDGSDWEIKLGGDSARGVRKVVSNTKLLLDSPYEDTWTDESYELYPEYDTVNNVNFATVGDACMIADGEHMVKRWRHKSFDPGYYFVDSARVDSVYFYKWGGTNGFHCYVVLDEFLTGGPYGFSSEAWGEADESDYCIPEYADYHYCLMVYDGKTDRWLQCPIINEWNSVDSAFTAPPRRNRLGIMADSVQYWALMDAPETDNGTVYITAPLSAGFAFSEDTIYSGVVDSMICDPCSSITQYMCANLVYDSDVTDGEAFEDLHSGPYVFVVDTISPYWSEGVPCFFEVDSLPHTRTTDTILSVLKPINDDNNTALAVLPAGTEFHVLLRYPFPRSRFVLQQMTRTWYFSEPDDPNMMYMSALYDETDVNPAHYTIIGVEDNEGITAVSGLFNQRWIYKNHNIHAQIGNHPNDITTQLRQRVGAWSDGFVQPYRNIEFTMNDAGVVAFDGSGVTVISNDIQTFFDDSINKQQLAVVRGAVLNDALLISYPSSGSSQVDKGLWFDLTLKKWMTTSLVGSAFLRRTSPNSYDSLLIGDVDSAKIYVYGATTDDEVAITGSHTSPYFDLGSPEEAKTVEKLLFSVKCDASAGLIVSIYQDTLTVATWVDTLLSATGADHWDLLETTVKRLRECRKFSIGIETTAADTLVIDYVKAKVRPKGEAGGL